MNTLRHEEVAEAAKEEYSEQVTALANHLGIGKQEIEQSTYDDDVYEADGAEYLVIDDDAATDRAYEYIKDTLWAFNSEFLANFTYLPVEEFEALQPQCESANDAIEKIIGNKFKRFADTAIATDGRGHFMSSYDGEENFCMDFYIYRTN